MSADQDDDELAVEGWDVLSVGRRQAWLFVTLGSPGDREERTIWIDTNFTVSEPSGRSHGGASDVPSDAPLALLEPLAMLTVQEVRVEPDALALRFNDGSTLTVSNTPNARESQGWWLGRGT